MLERLLFASRFAPLRAPLPCTVPPRREPAPPCASGPTQPAAPAGSLEAHGAGSRMRPRLPGALSEQNSFRAESAGKQVPSQEILNCLREHRGNTEETFQDLVGQLDRKLPLRAHPAVVLCAVPPPRSRLKSALRACPCRLDVGGQVGQEGEEKAGGQAVFQSGAAPHMHGARALMREARAT